MTPLIGGLLTDAFGWRSAFLVIAAFGVLLAGVIGLADDRFDLRARWQLAGQLVISAVPIAFGIRNVTDIPAALKEAHRVLRRGGRFFCLEFSTTQWPGFAEIYDAYSHHVVPKLGKLLANDEDSYRYLIESIRRFPPMPRSDGPMVMPRRRRSDAGIMRVR